MDYQELPVPDYQNMPLPFVSQLGECEDCGERYKIQDDLQDPKLCWVCDIYRMYVLAVGNLED